jgi:uncharacterized membrane protein
MITPVVISTYLVVRLLHVLLGAIWVGTVTFSAFVLMPALQEAGPDAAKVMAGLQRRRFMDLLPIVALINVLSGLWLYWRFTAGFDATISASPGGIAFGTGGALAIVAFMIGVLVMRRSLIRAGGLAARASSTTDPAERSKLMGQAAALRIRAGRAGRVVAVLLIITTLLMAAGHRV